MYIPECACAFGVCACMVKSVRAWWSLCVYSEVSAYAVELMRVWWSLCVYSEVYAYMVDFMRVYWKECLCLPECASISISWSVNAIMTVSTRVFGVWVFDSALGEISINQWVEWVTSYSCVRPLPFWFWHWPCNMRIIKNIIKLLFIKSA